MADNETPARNGYGESTQEELAKSGYRYPASHFTPPVPLEEAVGGENRAPRTDGGTDGGTARPSNVRRRRKAK